MDTLAEKIRKDLDEKTGDPAWCDKCTGCCGDCNKPTQDRAKTTPLSHD